MRCPLRGARGWAACGVLGLVLAVAALRPAQAIDSTPPLPSAQLQQRYETLVHELRCMQCQDESLADSPVDLAADMRAEVRDLVLKGQSNQQVLDYMASRYGPFILFKPPMNWHNAWLWGAPGALMILGALVAWRVLSTRRVLLEHDDSELTDETLES